jgi:hypothetical protein
MSVEAMLREASGMIPIEKLAAELEQTCQNDRPLACDRALFPFVNRCLNLFEHQCDIVSAEGRMIHIIVAKKDQETGHAVRGS